MSRYRLRVRSMKRAAYLAIAATIALFSAGVPLLIILIRGVTP